MGMSTEKQFAEVSFLASDVAKRAAELGVTITEETAAELLDEWEDELQIDMMECGGKIIDRAIENL